jgi:hypothetical protein
MVMFLDIVIFRMSKRVLVDLVPHQFLVINPVLQMMLLIVVGKYLLVVAMFSVIIKKLLFYFFIFLPDDM